jgi:cysteine desulfurase
MNEYYIKGSETVEAYLDNSATTKPRQEVVEKMIECLTEKFGNPSSLHRKGVEAEKIIKEARASIAKALGCKDEEIIFTSGGTESNNIAIRGALAANKRIGNHIITTKIEHASVLHTFQQLEKEGYKVTYLDVDKYGYVDLDQFKKSIQDDTVLVSVMHVNNEVGSIQPVEEMGKILGQKGSRAIFHVDGVQSFGKLRLNPSRNNIHLFALSSHKIHGPKGVGALFIKKGTKVSPLVTGGEQESGLRSGTENVPGIAGLGVAAKLCCENLDKNLSHLFQLRKRVIDNISDKIDFAVLNSPREEEKVAPHIINFSFPGIKSEVLLHSLEGHGVYVSTGSACASHKHSLSHVLSAMNLNKKNIDGAIRISLSPLNTMEEINYGCEKICNSVLELSKVMGR